MGRAFYIQQWCKSLLFFMSFTKNQGTLSRIIHKSSQKTPLRILASIIRFPDMSSFLLAGVASILWTLEKDVERFWGFNICSLSLLGRIVELISLFTRLSFTDSLFTFDKPILVFTIFTTSFLNSQETFSFLMSLGSLFNSAKFLFFFFSSLPRLPKLNFPFFYGIISKGHLTIKNQK